MHVMKLIVANNGSTTSYRGNRTGRIKTRTYGANKGIFFSNSDRNSKKKGKDYKREIPMLCWEV